MRNIRIAYIVFAALIFYLLHLLYIAGKIPFAVFSVLFLLLAPLGYLYSRKFLYVFYLAPWIVLFPFFIFIYRIDALNAGASILLFNLLLYGCARAGKSIKATKETWDVQIGQKENMKKSYTLEAEEFNGVESQVRDREITTVNLYEITKKMSESLTFDDIFGVFSRCLKENFNFSTCELMLLKEAEQGLALDRAYRVSREAEVARSDKSLDFKRLISLFKEYGNGVYFDSSHDGAILESVGLSDSVNSLIAIPLLSEKKLVGIVTINDLSRMEYERFAILAIQFALEIKKVLLYETVEELAITDGLTGLYVRRHFMGRLHEEVNRSKRYSFRFAFLMVDIDDFKKCNDTYGHLVGDVVLRDIGRIMKECVREIDLVARYGGEEFSLVLTETDYDGAMLVAERIRRKVEESAFKAYDETLKVTISIGVAVYPEDAVDPTELIDKADRALYNAKRAGKNLVRGYKR